MDNRMKITSQWCDKTMNVVMINDNYWLLTAELSGPHHQPTSHHSILIQTTSSGSQHLSSSLFISDSDDWLISEICFCPIKSCGLFIHMNVIQFFCMVPFFVVLIKLAYKGFVCNYNWLSSFFVDSIVFLNRGITIKLFTICWVPQAAIKSLKCHSFSVLKNQAVRVSLCKCPCNRNKNRSQ